MPDRQRTLKERHHVEFEKIKVKCTCLDNVCNAEKGLNYSMPCDNRLDILLSLGRLGQKDK